MRLSMRKVRELLRLHWECGLSTRQIARSTGIGRTTPPFVRAVMDRCDCLLAVGCRRGDRETPEISHLLADHTNYDSGKSFVSQ